MRPILPAIQLLLLVLLAFPAVAQFVLTSSSPQKNQTGVPISGNLEFTFSEPVEPSSIAGSIKVVSRLQGHVSGSLSSLGNVITFDPIQDFVYGDEITASLFTSLESQSSNSLAVPIVLRFTTDILPSPAEPPVFRDTEIFRNPDGIPNTNIPVDFDKDGDIDLVYSVGWLENDGQGNFANHVITPQVPPETFEVADLDNDGDFDIVVGSIYLGITTLINDGQQQFTSTRHTGDFINAIWVEVADFDFNGLPDILYSRDQVSTNILYNQGGNVFTSTAISPTRADKVVVVDFDKDGDFDVIQQDFTEVRLLKNSGSGFQLSVLITGSIHGISAGDFDNDGDIDIVSSVDEFLQIYENNGSGILSSKVIYTTDRRFVPGDFDGDNDLDIVIPEYRQLSMLVNDGQNNFHRIPIGIVADGSTIDLSPVDLDSDGDLDFSVSFNSIIIKFYKNTNLDEVYPFTPLEDIEDLSLGDSDWGDYDNDGDLDLLLTGLSDNIPTTALYANYLGQFTEVTIAVEDVYYGSCDWGDFDNDGDLDILVMGATQTEFDNHQPTTLIYVNENGVFELHPLSLDQLPGGEDGKARWADFNNDGWLDIIIFARGGSGIYQSDGFGNFTLRFALPAIYSSASMEVGDYDADGDTDLAIAGWGGNEFLGTLLEVYRNDGDWKFTEASGDFQGRLGGNLNWADTDNDGDLDLLAAGNTRLSDGWQIPSFTNYENQAGVFQALPDQPSWSIDASGTIAAGDFNNDGSTDVLASTQGGSSYDPAIVLIKNDGQGMLAPMDVQLPKIVTRTMSWADYDDDGDLDAFGRKLFRNNNVRKNTTPTPPSIVALDSVHNNSLYFHWNDGSDIENSAPGLSYQHYVGTASGTQDVLGANANLSSGLRTVASIGSNKGNHTIVTNLYGGTYYFGVQSIDAAFEGSAFSPEAQALVIGIHGSRGSCRDLEYSYTAKPSGNYSWAVTGGTIIFGQNTDSIVVKWTSLGTGWVKVANDQNIRNTLVVEVDEKPNPILSGDASVCTGTESYTVIDPLTHYTDWSVSSSNTIIDPSDTQVIIDWKFAGNHQLVAEAFPEHRGCSTTVILPVAVDVRPIPNILGPSQVCSDRVEIYTTSALKPNWEVTFGTKIVDSTQYIRARWPTSGGNGTVKITEASTNNFCSATITHYVIVNQSPPRPSIFQLGISDTLISTPSPSDYYVWLYNNQEVLSGPYIGIITNVPGYYSVVVYINSCGTISLPFPFRVPTSIESGAQNHLLEIPLRLYPNPANQTINIELNNAYLGECQVRIYSSTQVHVKEFSIDKTDQILRQEMDVSDLSAGLYVLVAESGTEVRAIKFLKR